MAVIDLESMPLGFRFHPTDVELVNHYLKRKIDGRIKSDGVAVIPEVDVCRCEPWDLPSRSVIRSADPEWFFFSPRDRKYPNGSRHNRATEAGYWKATGKDRLIKSPCGLIGMKKTLVFYRGRAPRAERTHWIMHEYRTTEPEFESGKQGGFVLCRLFKKTEENQDPNTDEIEGSGFSPTLTRSLPSETQHVADAFEESATPLDKKPSEINSRRDSQTLLATADNQPEASHSNSIMASNECDHEAEVVGTEVGPYPDDLSQFLGSNSEQLGSIEFPYISSPLRLTDFQFDEFFDQGPFREQHDSINELSDAFIIDEECDFTKVLNNMACLRSQYNLSCNMEGSTGNGIEIKAQNPQYSSSSNFGAQQGSAIRRLRMKGLVRRKKHNRVIKVPALEKLKQVIKEREDELVHFPDNGATGINPNLLDHESKRKLGSRRRDIGTEILHLETTRTGSPRVVNRVFVAVILAIPLLTCLMALMVKLVTSR